MAFMRIGVLGAVAVLVGACGSTGGSGSSGSPPAAGAATSVASTPGTSATPKPSRTPYPDRLPRPTPFPSDATCAPEHACLGILEAGDHRTESFQPAFSFTVPDGWANLEYSGGYFELLRSESPGDAILFYARPRPQRPNGSTPPGSFRTPQDIASWLAANPALRTTPARSVDVGGLTGLSVDVEVAPDSTEHPTWCEVTTCVGFLHGEDAAPTWQWDLAVVSSEKLRLYLLDAGDDLVAIAVDSIDGTTFDAVTERADAILASLRFDTP